jgi:aminopeptidase N
MEMHFTVPKPLKVISNGNLISEKSIGSKLTTFSWKVQYPINNYNVSLYIGNYEHIHDTYQASDSSILDLDYYVLPNHKTIAESHFKQSHKVLRAFEFYFGKYPFWKDGYALVEAPYLGMEHQSAIAYGNEFKQGYLGAMVPKRI